MEVSGGMTEKRPVTSIRDALASFFARRKWTKRVDQMRVLDEWPELVGGQIAAVTEPESVLLRWQLGGPGLPAWRDLSRFHPEA